MKVIDIAKDKELFLELIDLVCNNNDVTLDTTSALVKDTNFYKEVQTAHKLIATRIIYFDYDYYRDDFEGVLKPKMALLIAQIAATSPTLVDVDFSMSAGSFGYRKGEGVGIAEALAKSKSLKNVIMNCNEFESLGVNIAAALAKSISIKSVDFSNNEINNYAPEVAQAFTNSCSIRFVDMTKNGRGLNAKIVERDTVAKTISVFEEHNQEVSNFEEVKQREMVSALIYPLIELIGEYVGNNIEYDVS